VTIKSHKVTITIEDVDTERGAVKANIEFDPELDKDEVASAAVLAGFEAFHAILNLKKAKA
jgi:hypothetical protein